jgi:ApbE superfamily uncharacterized protein (UPF0280 family)
MQRAQTTWLPDGQRLHLHHGPIDMIVGVTGPGRKPAMARAAARFETLLEELMAELPRLRQPTGPTPTGETARLMHNATRPFAPAFITPMAAVAGAGAETILTAILAGPDVHKAYVNNGGDVAFHLSPGEDMQAAIASDPPGMIRIGHDDNIHGIATSGWRGRSHSLGIADSVTVLARSAAEADAAATMIANAVDLPGHPAITRLPAHALAPDSDLGGRLVTSHVGPLSPTDAGIALQNGLTAARQYQADNLIIGACLTLAGQTCTTGHFSLISNQQTELQHA